MPAAVFGSVKMLFAPAVLDGGGVLGGAVVGLPVDGDVVAGAAGAALGVDVDERVARKTPAPPPITMTTASTTSTIVVVERPLLAGAVYAYGADP
jgi:hypothetical protein